MKVNFAHYSPWGYVILTVVFALVVVYWIAYTRRLKVPRNTGKEEGIAIATQEKERAGRTGSVD